ncbi:MAG: sulfotransferase [Acidimicrobiales bacterium]|jgi:hypothetical protein|nr:sulfotransferase [Acidimicrobiales bacterium]
MLRSARARARILFTAPWRLPPRFFVLGAQRSGTTSLFAWLQRHPDVPSSLHKELHHFEQPRPPSTWYYRSRFPLAVRGRRRLVAGEATPEYLFLPWAPPRIAAAVPDARYLVVLREPLARACSHHALARRRGKEPLGLADSLRAEPGRLRHAGWPTDDPIACDFETVSWRGYLERGRYAGQLERWYRLVGRERLLVLRFEDLVADPTRHASQIQEFLGLRVVLTGAEWPHEHASAPSEVLDADTAAWARAQFAPDDERLAELTAIRWP